MFVCIVLLAFRENKKELSNLKIKSSISALRKICNSLNSAGNILSVTLFKQYQYFSPQQKGVKCVDACINIHRDFTINTKTSVKSIKRDDFH